ncbi:hypothetical protein ARMSODRAFT_620580 [Armillaria solidipes]|uniref:Uncharacterized protein n=1 Tax=Armillaria solidipes TaxID=1076256 RepID=A0A2H3B403_9AGAR|nr:hypothetical protein ARMSODRAFT_620580 [Armillaria solidipes]
MFFWLPISSRSGLPGSEEASFTHKAHGSLSTCCLRIVYSFTLDDLSCICLMFLFAAMEETTRFCIGEGFFRSSCYPTNQIRGCRLDISPKLPIDGLHGSLPDGTLQYHIYSCLLTNQMIHLLPALPNNEKAPSSTSGKVLSVTLSTPLQSELLYSQRQVWHQNIAFPSSDSRLSRPTCVAAGKCIRKDQGRAAALHQ